MSANTAISMRLLAEVKQASPGKLACHYSGTWIVMR